MKSSLSIMLLSVLSLNMYGEGPEYGATIEDRSFCPLVDEMFKDAVQNSKKKFIKDMRFLCIDHKPFLKELFNDKKDSVGLKMAFGRKPENIIGKQSEIEKSLLYTFNTDYPNFFYIKKDIVFKKDFIIITLSDGFKSVENDMINIVENGKI